MKRFNPTPQRVVRPGESLVEMVVVMSVIAGLASLSWPTIRNSMSKSRLQSAAKQVSADLSKARLLAIESGVAQEFRYQPDQSCYEIAPRSTSDVEHQTVAVNPSAETSEEEQSQSEIHRELMDGLKFVLHGQQESPRQETIVASAESEWSKPIVFFPNGRASQATVELEGDEGMRVEIQLNGMTGTTKLGRLQKMESRTTDHKD